MKSSVVDVLGPGKEMLMYSAGPTHVKSSVVDVLGCGGHGWKKYCQCCAQCRPYSQD